MPIYSLRRVCSQLCCVTLTLAFLGLPLASVKPERAPILSPLDTNLVPLGASLQSPPDRPFQPPSLLATSRLVFGPLPASVLALCLFSDGRLHVTNQVFHNRITTAKPNCRSPPSA